MWILKSNYYLTSGLWNFPYENFLLLLWAWDFIQSKCFFKFARKQLYVICIYLFITYPWNNNMLEVLLNFGQLKSPKMDRKCSKTDMFEENVSSNVLLRERKGVWFHTPKHKQKKDWKAKFSEKKLRFHLF